MCGIVALLLDQQKPLPADKRGLVAQVLVEGLQRLEYRGYDSAGIALVDSTTATPAKLRVMKRVGKVAALRDACAQDLKGEMGAYVCLGIAHTRWATHGVPSDTNAHPHTSEDGMLAVVHNGIIENYSVLRRLLEAEGYKFKSETDTEVLAHLIRHVQKMEPSLALEDAVTLALTQVKGAYGIAVIDAKTPDVLVGARRGSPLLLGVGKGLLALASDAAALVGRVDHVVYLEEADLVVCRDGKHEVRALDGPRPSTNELGQQPSVSPRNGLPMASESETESGFVANATAAASSMGATCETSSPAQLTRTGSRLDRGIARASKRVKVPETVDRRLHALELSLEKIEKGGHKHFMIKEILEQPSVLRDCLRGRVGPDGEAVRLGGLVDKMDRIAAARRIIITACGTSWHSAQVAEYMIESLCGVPVEVEYASEFRYRNPIIFPEDVVVVISQSGETADTLEAVRIAKSKNALTLGFVNVVGSTIARTTDAGVYLHVGPEIGVASTKAFSGQVMALALFSIMLGSANGRLTPARSKELIRALQSVPAAVEQALRPELRAEVLQLARVYRYATNFLFLGRGPNMPVALEGALKLKEISYIHAEGYPAAELKHGPIALIDRQMPVVVIAPRCDATYEKVKSSIEEVVARSGSVIVITDEGNHELDKLAEHVIRVPVVDEFVSPLITVVPLQLLAYHIADLRGCPIDQPRNLAKSVTVE